MAEGWNARLPGRINRLNRTQDFREPNGPVYLFYLTPTYMVCNWKLISVLAKLQQLHFLQIFLTQRVVQRLHRMSTFMRACM